VFCNRYSSHIDRYVADSAIVTMDEDDTHALVHVAQNKCKNRPILMTVMEQLAKVANKTLSFQDDQKSDHVENMDLLEEQPPRRERSKQYAKKPVGEAPSTYNGTPEEWLLLTNKQRYRALNSVKIKAYGIYWRANNKTTTSLSVYKRQYRKREKQSEQKRAGRVGIVRKVSSIRPATKARLRYYHAQPVNRARVLARNKARASRVQFIEKAYVTEFLKLHPDVPTTSAKMTDTQAHVKALELLNSRDPAILEAFQGKTLREVFERGMLYASLYVYLSRGTGLSSRSGQSYPECQRFLIADPNPILTQVDGVHYKRGQQAFKNLELRSISLCSFDTVSAAASVEAALQKHLDGLTYGTQKLRMIAGVGRIRATFRRCDILSMLKIGDFRPQFTVGITWIENVRWRSTNAHNIVNSITSGSEGQASIINYRKTKRWTNTLARDREMFSDM
jgi:hypothetical protein